MKIAMFDTKPYDMDSFEALKPEGMKIKYFETRLTEDTVSLAKGYDAVIVFVNDDVNKAVLEALYSLGVKLVALRCAGYNNVDLDYCRAHNIKVANVVGYGEITVAEFAVGLLLNLTRNILLNNLVNRLY